MRIKSDSARYSCGKVVTGCVRLGILGFDKPRRIMLGVSEKRPETDADIITRSQIVTGGAIGRRDQRRSKESKYSLDLPAHMAECDANFLRLMKLFPDMQDRDEQTFALHFAGNEAKVVLGVVERGPYTTLLNLRQEPEVSWGGTPSIRIRVYHDAKSAEVAEIQNQNRFYGVYEYPNARMRQRDEKAQINRFLGEFLTLCLEHGASTDPLHARLS
jgi:uncharacterized protein YqiB (DUF1249 family)